MRMGWTGMDTGLPKVFVFRWMVSSAYSITPHLLNPKPKPCLKALSTLFGGLLLRRSHSSFEDFCRTIALSLLVQPMSEDQLVRSTIAKQTELLNIYSPKKAALSQNRFMASTDPAKLIITQPQNSKPSTNLEAVT